MGNRAVKGPLSLLAEKTGRELILAEMRLDAFTADSLFRTGLIRAIAEIQIILFRTFHL